VTKIVTRLIVAFLILSFFNSVALANGQEGKPSSPSPEAIVADVLVLRPFGLGGTILGAAAFVISLPVTLPFRQTERVGEYLVMTPLHFTFERPLGQMHR
jgi:hypothetical protein